MGPWHPPLDLEIQPENRFIVFLGAIKQITDGRLAYEFLWDSGSRTVRVQHRTGIMM